MVVNNKQDTRHQSTKQESQLAQSNYDICTNPIPFAKLDLPNAFGYEQFHSGPGKAKSSGCRPPSNDTAYEPNAVQILSGIHPQISKYHLSSHQNPCFKEIMLFQPACVSPGRKPSSVKREARTSTTKKIVHCAYLVHRRDEAEVDDLGGYPVPPVAHHSCGVVSSELAVDLRSSRRQKV